MGNCAGCTNPIRSNRHELSRQPQNPFSPEHPLKYSSKHVPFSNSIYRNSPSFTQNNQAKLIRESVSYSFPLEDPWKSRIASRKIKDYRREPTLQEEQELKNLPVTQQSPQMMQQKSMRSDSLEQSIINRYNYNTQSPVDKLGMRSSSNAGSNSNSNMFKSGEKDRLKDRQIGKSGRWKEQSATLHEIQQNSMQRFNTPANGTPLNRRLNMSNTQNQKNYNTSSYDRYEQPSMSKPYDKYLPKKGGNYRDRKLAEILELMQQDAETPAYVKSQRKEQGEDIRMNNFGKFDAVGPFEWFSMGKYLGQITSDDQEEEKEQNNNSKGKISNGQKPRNNPEQSSKKPELKMIPEQVGESKFTVKAA